MKTEHRRRGALAALGLLAIGVTTVLAPRPVHAQPPEPAVAASVESQVEAGGVADVIVSLRTSIPATPAPGPAGATERREALDRASRAFVRQLPDEIERTANPRASRFVNLQVDAAGLDALRDDDAVAAVLANEQRSLSLAKSAPAVGAPIAWASGYTGDGATVAILDTGVQSDHPFFGGRVVAEACFSGGTTISGASSLCDNGPNSGEPCTMSGCEHGTHVAGIAAGNGGPSGAPAGVAKGADIISVMIATRIDHPQECPFGCLTLFDADVFAALDWVQSLQGTHDIVAANMSFGGGASGGDCDEAVNSADPLYWYTTFFSAFRSAGIAPVVASGNDQFPNEISAPACISSAVSVGAVTTDDVRVPFWSNSSSTLDLLAPGTNTELGNGILSSVPESSGFARIPGTSMAAPHVVGAFAVLQEAYPGIPVDFAEALLKVSGRPVTDARQNRTTPLIQLDEAIPRPKGTYHPVDPARLLDTRTGLGAPGGQPAKIGANKSIDLQVTGRSQVPSNGVSAVVLNVTYVLPTSVGFVSVWPTGALRPNASNLNLYQGDARPNLVTARMGAGGKVSIYNAIGAVDVIADVAGWYDDDPANTGSYFHPTSPERLLDTRVGVGAPQAKVGAGGKLTLDVTGAADLDDTLVPDGATAVVVNLTGTGATAGTHVTAYPANLANPPTVSNLNLAPGQTRPNLAVVPLDADGEMTLYNNAGAIDLIADIQGWYDGDGAGLRFVPKTPTRILDTRVGLGGFGALGAGATRDLRVAGVAGIQSDVLAPIEGVVMNLTSTGVTAGGYVVAFPDGPSPAPFASNLNLEVGRDVPNLVSTRLGGDRISLYNAIGSVHLIGDVAGWFEP